MMTLFASMPASLAFDGDENGLSPLVAAMDDWLNDDELVRLDVSDPRVTRKISARVHELSGGRQRPVFEVSGIRGFKFLEALDSDAMNLD